MKNTNPILNEIYEFIKLARDEQSGITAVQAAELFELAERFLKGELSEKDFKSLLQTHKRLIKQNLNTLEIQVRAKAEKILFSILEIIKNKIVSSI